MTEFSSFLKAALCLMIFAAGVGGVYAQSPGLQNVYKSSEAAPVKKTVTKKTGGASKPDTAANESARRQTARSRRDLQTVTFITAEPQLEIWLNDRLLGQTDGEKKLTRKLVSGEYRVVVKKNSRVLVPTQKITISDKNNVFNLTAADKPGEEPTTQPSGNSRTTVKETKTELQTAVETSAKVKKILDDYSNPETTDQVTTQDWELVYQAAQLGQFQDFTAVQIEAQRWFASGQLELAKNNYPNAFTAFTKSIEFMPQSGLPFYGLGTAYLANKQYGESIKAFQKSIQLTPKFAPVYSRLGDAQRLSGKDKEAVASYNKAVELGYKTPETRYRLAALLLQTKHPEDAVKQLEEVSKVWQKAEVYTSLGDGYEVLKRDVSAIPAYQRAIELDPKYAPAYFKLGSVYFDQHEYQKARDAFQKAAELDPDGKLTNRAEVQKRLREANGKIK